MRGRKVYERLFDYVTDTNLDDQVSARECFEFILYGLFAVDGSTSTEEDVAKLQTWFENTRRMRTKLGAKLKRCERNYGGAFYLGDSRRTVSLGGRLWFPLRRYAQGQRRM